MTEAANVAADPQAVWLVTGCSSGFGKALSAELHARGRTVVATAREPGALGHLPDDNPRVLKAALDVTKPATVATAFEAAQGRFGRVDVVVNNAGIGVIGAIEDATDAEIRHQFEVNVFGVFNVTRAAQPIFRAQCRGLFINFASVAGEKAVPSLGIYSASKFAVEGLSEAIRQEMEPYGVRVLIIEPGPFDTEWIGKNAVWTERTDRYPGVWDYVTGMKAFYADRGKVGDPALAAKAIIDTAAMDDPPFRLALQEMTVAAVREKAAQLAADADRMERVSASIHDAPAA